MKEAIRLIDEYKPDENQLKLTFGYLKSFHGLNKNFKEWLKIYQKLLDNSDDEDDDWDSKSQVPQG